MRILLVFIAMLVQALLFSQKKENINKSDSLENFLKEKQRKVDSLKKLNFMDMPYKYLDSNFNIRIGKKEFESIIQNPNTIESYKDSLMVILIHELGDYNAVNIAFHEILFNWKQMSYYLLEDEQKTKELGNYFGFKHPSRFFKFLEAEAIENPKKTELLISLKFKLSEIVGDTIELKPYHNLLINSFRHNPQRIQDMIEYRKKYSKCKN